LVVLNVVERLPVLSEGLMAAVDEGEPYETLCRQLRVLHHNLVEIARSAAAAKVSSVKETASCHGPSPRRGPSGNLPSPSAAGAVHLLD
jgi:hypothetical protein